MIGNQREVLSALQTRNQFGHAFAFGVLVEINDFIFDLVLFQEPRAVTPLFANHRMRVAQNAKRAQGYVVGIADGGGDDGEHLNSIWLAPIIQSLKKFAGGYDIHAKSFHFEF